MEMKVIEETIKKELAEMKIASGGKTVQQFVAQVQQKMNLLENTTLNIAITGIAGAGKSSLVNALRGVADDDEKNAAKTGVVETTKKRAKYTHPKFSSVVLWDLPGIGTPNFKADEYLQDVKFREYDFFIIVSKDRFTEHDANLAREIQKMGKKFFFVRTQIDMNLLCESKKSGFNEERTLEQIKNYCMENLRKAGMSSSKVFLISSWDLKNYDFPLLQEALVEDLNDLKRQVLILALPAYSEDIMAKKKSAMEALIWERTLISSYVGAIPIPGVSFLCDVIILMKTMKEFCHAFGLDEDALQSLAKRIGKPVQELKSAITKSPLAGEIKKKYVWDRLIRFSACSLATVAEMALDTVPILGSVCGAGLSFATTNYMLKGFLNDVVEDAENVCAKAAK